MEDFTNAFLILKGFGYGEENVNEAKMMRKLKMLFSQMVSVEQNG